MTGSCASETVHDSEDIIDLKDEPVEVSYCFSWVWVRVLTNTIYIFVLKMDFTVSLVLVVLSQIKCMSFMEVFSNNLPILKFHSFCSAPTPPSCFFRVNLGLKILLRNMLSKLYLSFTGCYGSNVSRRRRELIDEKRSSSQKCSQKCEI